MGKRSRIKIFAQPSPTFIAINRSEALRQWPGRASPAQGQRTGAVQQWLDGSAKLRPELDLSRDGAFSDFRSQSRVEHDIVREFHGLTHAEMVAFCYQAGNAQKEKPPAGESGWPFGGGFLMWGGGGLGDNRDQPVRRGVGPSRPWVDKARGVPWKRRIHKPCLLHGLRRAANNGPGVLL